MKRHIVFSCFLFLLSFHIYGQKKDSNVVKRNSIGIIFSNDYAYRSLTSDGSSISNLISQSRDEMEIPKYSYTAGISYMMSAFIKNFLIESGLFFSDKGYGTKLVNAYFPSGTTGTYSVDYKYYYLDIPLLANYMLQYKKIRFYVTTGVALNIFITASTNTILNYTDGPTFTYSEKNDPRLSSLDLSFNAGIGASYDISKRIFIKIEPAYRRFLTPDVSNVPIKEYPYSFGIITGVYYRF